MKRLKSQPLPEGLSRTSDGRLYYASQKALAEDLAARQLPDTIQYKEAELDPEIQSILDAITELWKLSGAKIIVPAARVVNTNECSEVPTIRFVEGFPERLITPQGSFSIIGSYMGHSRDQLAAFGLLLPNVYAANENNPLPLEKGLLHGNFKLF